MLKVLKQNGHRILLFSQVYFDVLHFTCVLTIVNFSSKLEVVQLAFICL